MDRLRQIFASMATFSSNEWMRAEEKFEIRQWKANELVFRAEDHPDKVYFLMDGRARYFYLTINGSEKTKSIVRTGGALASISTLTNNEPSPFCAQMLTDSVTASIDYSTLIELADKHPAWNLLVRKILEKLILKNERREASFLLMSARQRYEQFLSEFENEADAIPLKHVAMYLGVTTVTLSRIRRAMDLI